MLKKAWNKVTNKSEKESKQPAKHEPKPDPSEVKDPIRVNTPSKQDTQERESAHEQSESSANNETDLKPFKNQPKYIDHKNTPGMVILEGSEKLEFSPKENFKKEIEKIAARGETLGFTIKVKNPCNGDIKVSPSNFSFKPYTMISLETKTPSSKELHVGTYYDSLVPMDEPACPNKQEICKQSPYRWVDIKIPRNISPGIHKVQIIQGGDSVTVKLNIKDFTIPAVPSMPLRIPMSNWAAMNGHCPKDKNGPLPSCHKELELSDMYQNFLRENRIEPYDNAIKTNVTNNSYDKEYFDEVISDCRNTALGLPSIKGLDGLNDINEILKRERKAVEEIKAASLYQKAKKIKSWFYTWDEPDINDKKTRVALQERLDLQKKHAPNVSTMITSPLYSYDQNGNKVQFKNVDIYCPQVDQFDQPGFPTPEEYKKAGKEVWLYSACPAHGNCSDDPNLSGKSDPSGAPDFMIDRPAVDIMAFFAQGYKYKTNGLLYYNSGEHYMRKDPWKDFNSFGGNGDGALMNPLTGSKDKPGKFGCIGDAIAPSIRLKKMNEASQNFEWLKGAPNQIQMESAVNELVKGTKNWSHTASDYEDLKKLAFP